MHLMLDNGGEELHEFSHVYTCIFELNKIQVEYIKIYHKPRLNNDDVINVFPVGIQPDP